MEHVIVRLALLATLTATPVHAAELLAGNIPVTAQEFVTGLSHPWGMAVMPDGALLVTERDGRLRIVRDGVLSAPVAGVPDVVAEDQGGLLDVVLAPDFASSRTIYFTFSEPGDGGQSTAAASARLVEDGGAARLENVRVIFSMGRKTGTTHHFGSRIVPAPDGSIFITTGDRGDMNRAQDFSDHAGAVIRVRPDGTIPEDNPFAGDGKILPEIWSKGHRNMQGAIWDKATSSLWTIEHGARGGDELNNPKPGRNYGWPVISFGTHYSGDKIGKGAAADGYEQPAFYWDPSIAPSGLAVYDGAMFPEWQGDFLVGALKFQLLSRLDRRPDGSIAGEERFFEGKFGRIRDVEVASDGAILLLTDDDPGSIIRIERAKMQKVD